MSQSEEPVTQFTTNIWHEEPSPHNPYLAQRCSVRGYDLIELMKGRSWVDVWYLLFQGELPTEAQSTLLEHLMIGLIGPGPRHPASRAVMTSTATMSEPVHMLSIGAALLGGEHGGGAEVRKSLKFLLSEATTPPKDVAERLAATCATPPPGEDGRIAPGFGALFSSPDTWALSLLSALVDCPAVGPHLEWARGFSTAIASLGYGPLVSGVAAAAFADLGFGPWPSAVLFQLIQSPGVLAHGLEYIGKRPNQLPFVKDEDYTIEDPS